MILSYADLKKYRFTYWFAFPALHSDPQWKRLGPVKHLDPKESAALVERVGTWRYPLDNREKGFFLAKKVRGKEAGAPSPLESPADEIGYRWEVASLGAFETGFFTGVDEGDRYVAFADPSTYPENPSWPLRNLLVLVRQRYHLRRVQILCYRDIQAKRHEARSIILPLAMDDVEQMETAEMPKVTGWERNGLGKLQARMASLGEYMDPTKLADQAVDLNLKLMKWRIAPSLDLDAIKETSCLLLGAGTLGSYVSRNLMGWGVRKITFVDYGSVSFSNPVRQPLFEFEDCKNGGKPKATRAAEALQQIYPGVESEGHVLSVPMLGHPITDEAKTRADFEKLQRLVDAHDVVFLLMDSRESRWLPTVMGKAAGKIVLNAALGFDTFVVMRHGAEKPAGGGGEAKTTLGCYFCNDVVAPADVSVSQQPLHYLLEALLPVQYTDPRPGRPQSQKDQTLDQQCTVTRPGGAAIASALLVELLVSILQHPARHHAPAPAPGAEERDPPDHALGLVPHQVRGFLSTFQNMVIRGESYPCCSACSAPVLEAYRQDGWAFVKRALDERGYVTELSGLAEVQRRAEAMAAEIEWSEDEAGDDDGEAVLL